jgi:hypothetical protein
LYGRCQCVAHALRGDARSRQVLLIVESYDLRAARGTEVPLEIGWDVHGSDRFA